MHVRLKFQAIAVLLPLTASFVGLVAQSVTAQPGLEGSYLGVAVDGDRMQTGLPSLFQEVNQQGSLWDAALRQFSNSATPTTQSPSEQAATGKQFQGRLDLPNNRLSVRGSVFMSDEANAVLPTVTYDLPVGKSSNVYAGAGYAIVNNAAGTTTPLGNQNGVVLTTGFEASAGRNLVIFGDTKLNLNDDRATGNSPVRFQFGAGYRF